MGYIRLSSDISNQNLEIDLEQEEICLAEITIDVLVAIPKNMTNDEKEFLIEEHKCASDIIGLLKCDDQYKGCLCSYTQIIYGGMAEIKDLHRRGIETTQLIEGVHFKKRMVGEVLKD